jgi:hypothetical protein
MSTFDTTLPASASSNVLARPLRPSAAPAVRLLCTVALVSAAAGGSAALVLERLLDVMAPPRHSAPAAPAMPTSPGASMTGDHPQPNWPAVHDVLTDRAEPPLEPPPAP